jgi:hypothetical protein
MEAGTQGGDKQPVWGKADPYVTLIPKVVNQSWKRKRNKRETNRQRIPYGGW